MRHTPCHIVVTFWLFIVSEEIKTGLRIKRKIQIKSRNIDILDKSALLDMARIERFELSRRFPDLLP